MTAIMLENHKLYCFVRYHCILVRCFFSCTCVYFLKLRSNISLHRLSVSSKKLKSSQVDCLRHKKLKSSQVECKA